MEERTNTVPQPLAKNPFSTILESRTISSVGYKTLPYSGLDDIVGAGFTPALVSLLNVANGSLVNLQIGMRPGVFPLSDRSPPPRYSEIEKDFDKIAAT